jgi:SAM-dependent methyltransferase
MAVWSVSAAGHSGQARSCPPYDREVTPGTVDQQAQWTQVYATRTDFLGAEPSEPGRAALATFMADGVRDLLELGPGQGRDTLLFAMAGINVTALDYAEPGLARIVERARRQQVADRVTTIVGDVRQPLPMPDASVDACYGHMLLCMSLTTGEIERLTGEVRRVLRPGGLLVYTVRTTEDAHFGQGIDHGDDRFEMAGFVVHFFDRRLIDRLAVGWDVLGIAGYEEGRLPRRLVAVTMRKPPSRLAAPGP